MSMKDNLLLQLQDENDALKAKVKVLRANLRKEKRWACALLTAYTGDPLTVSQEKEFGVLLSKL